MIIRGFSSCVLLVSSLLLAACGGTIATEQPKQPSPPAAGSEPAAPSSSLSALPGSTAGIPTTPPLPGGSTEKSAISPSAGERKGSPTLTIYAIDVGQGDSTLIVGPGVGEDRKVLLIDAGPLSLPDGGRVVSNFFESQGIKHIDYVILTHFDADHVGGFAATHGSTSLLWQSSQNCKTQRTPLVPRLATYEHAAEKFDTDAAMDWNTCIASVPKRVRVTENQGLGDTLDLGGGFSAKIIAGNGYVLGRQARVANVKKENSLSVVTLVSGQNGFHFLVPGDASGQAAGDETAEVEVAVADYLSAKGIELDVLRVGHHGAENTSNPRFLSATHPRVAVISVGNEQPKNFKHPRCKTYESLANAQVNFVLQTEAGHPDCAKPKGSPLSADGTIRIDVSGSAYQVSTIPTNSAIGLHCTRSGCSPTGSTDNTPLVPTNNCCKICRNSQPCGDTCIGTGASCTKTTGSACLGE